MAQHSLASPERNPVARPVADHSFSAHLLDFCARTAATYDVWDSGVHAKAAQRCVEMAEPAPGSSVLDVGCGTGLVTAALADAGCRAVGVDLSPAMLEQAQRRETTASFLSMDARDLYLQDSAFDVVTLCQVLAYQVEPQRVLAEIRRVLRPNGQLVVCGQQRSLATPAEQLFFRRLDAFAATGLRIPRPPDHNALFGEPWALRSLLHGEGFTVQRTTNLVVGNHVENAAAWIELMRGAGPYPDALIGIMGEAMREQLQQALDLTMGSVEEGAFRYHRAFSFAVATRD